MPASDMPPGLSVSERALFEHLTEHLETESGLIEAYHDLADEEKHPAYVAFLAKLIVDDEARHHRLFTEWLDSMRAMTSLTGDVEGVPFPAREDDPLALVVRTEQLIAFEKQDARELKELEKELKDMKETTLWALLAEIMRMDTEKHVKILEFIHDHAKRTAKDR